MKDVAAPPRASASRYSTVAIVLHWTIAALIILQVALAGRMEGPASPQVFAIIQLHKSIGITVLLLSLARLGWRLVHRPPPETYPLARWEKGLAHAVHWGFYLIMIGMPLTGWLMVSASKLPIPTLLYGAVPWPNLPGFAGMDAAAKHVWHEIGEVGHGVLAKGVWVLFALHVAGALKHQLFKPGEPVLARMAPGAVVGRWFDPRLIAIALGFVAVVAFGRLVTPPLAHTSAAPPPAAPAAEPEAPAATAEPAAEAAPAEPEPAPEKAAPVEEKAAAAPQPAKPSAWAIAPGSTLGFSTTWGDQAIEGRFKTWSGDIVFSPDALDQSKVSISIDLSSADTGDTQRDAMLPSPDWFDAAGHPKATYAADRFEAKGGGRYVAKGKLTLRGVTRPLDLPFTLKIDGDKAAVSGVTTLDRTAFGVGQGEWQSTDQIPARVKVSVNLKATRR
ncbi:YceI family protein [Phenylobacterium sp.]|uniref:YceI family protein n=1 Tax=Phenylobacterium sp. TaxID=1871053 RepID=UPI0035B20A4F